MHVPRLYTSNNLSEGEILDLTGQAAHHVANVLRLKAGATVHIFDGRGHEHRASITTVNRSNVALSVREAVSTQMESCLDITLLQGIARNDHMGSPAGAIARTKLYGLDQYNWTIRGRCNATAWK